MRSTLSITLLALIWSVFVSFFPQVVGLPSPVAELKSVDLSKVSNAQLLATLLLSIESTGKVPSSLEDLAESITRRSWNFRTFDYRGEGAADSKHSVASLLQRHTVDCLASTNIDDFERSCTLSDLLHRFGLGARGLHEASGALGSGPVAAAGVLNNIGAGAISLGGPGAAGHVSRDIGGGLASRPLAAEGTLNQLAGGFLAAGGAVTNGHIGHDIGGTFNSGPLAAAGVVNHIGGGIVQIGGVQAGGHVGRSDGSPN